MQTIVRLFAGFVTRILARMGSHTVVTVDTTQADQAWWEEQLKEIQEQHYEELGNWYCQDVNSLCIHCGKVTVGPRWAGEDLEECNDCSEEPSYEEACF